MKFHLNKFCSLSGIQTMPRLGQKSQQALADRVFYMQAMWHSPTPLERYLQKFCLSKFFRICFILFILLPELKYDKYQIANMRRGKSANVPSINLPVMGGQASIFLWQNLTWTWAALSGGNDQFWHLSLPLFVFMILLLSELRNSSLMICWITLVGTDDKFNHELILIKPAHLISG